MHGGSGWFHLRGSRGGGDRRGRVHVLLAGIGGRGHDEGPWIRGTPHIICRLAFEANPQRYYYLLRTAGAAVAAAAFAL